MSLAEASESRKARLIALRKRKAGEAGYVKRKEDSNLLTDRNHSDEPVIKSRNFDPESRTLKKRTRDNPEAMDDTVENNVEGLAQQIIQEDEQRRAQELVSLQNLRKCTYAETRTLGCLQYRTQTTKLGP